MAVPREVAPSVTLLGRKVANFTCGSRTFLFNMSPLMVKRFVFVLKNTQRNEKGRTFAAPFRERGSRKPPEGKKRIE
ncbi:MAG: hypothetical protein IJ693_08840 [Bacteroidaceae bacterium]|nr:hypothetical protein [Bacteroidaceae bacterium]